MAFLSQLSIRNLALVEEVDLELSPGLNVLTGETGAGKSVLVGALSLILGARSSPDLVRAGAEEGSVEATFSLGPSDFPDANKGSDRGGEVVVRRTVRAKGRGRTFIDGQAASVGSVADLVRGWIELTSQHEHVTLLDPERHLDLLDQAGGVSNERGRLELAYDAAAEVRRRLRNLEDENEARLRRLEYLRFAIEEVDAVDPEVNELERLTSERLRLRNAETLLGGLGQAEAALYSGQGAIIDALGRELRRFDELARLDDRLCSEADSLRGLTAEIEELARSLARRQRDLEANPPRLLEVEERVDRLERLIRKHGRSLADVLDAREQMEKEREELEVSGSCKTECEADLRKLEHDLAEAAARLSSLRAKAAKRFEDQMGEALSELAFGETRLLVRLRPLAEVGRRGKESAEILLAPNRGEPPRPLRKCASGGELSRVLLAVKQVLASKSSVGTHIFDEVDTGIGGGVAEVLGAKLAQVSDAAQVLVVTHLAPVAAFADRHFQVVKRDRHGRTITEVEQLGEEATVRELARMLGGVRITARTLALADELRSRARARGSAEITRLMGRRSAASRPEFAAANH